MDQTISASSTLSVKRPRNGVRSRSTALLACGVAAGPLYLAIGLVEAFTRPGFDIRRHDLSLLSNGSLGWVQIGNFLLTGALVILGSMGMRQALRPGRGRTWGPILVGIYGVGLIGAGFFAADPAYGFPPGTPADAHAVSWHGLMHIVTGAVGFLSLIAACFVFARRFASMQRRGLAAYSVATGVLFLAGFVGIASGSGNGWTILGFWIALVVAWAWICVMAARLISELRRGSVAADPTSMAEEVAV